MPRPGRPPRGAVVLLLAALAAGAALRASSVARARLWLDEYIMQDLASLPTPAAVVRGIAESNNTPVYPLLLHGLIRVAGDGPLAFIEGADYPVAASLREALGRSFRFRPINRYNHGLFELVPLPREAGRAAEERRERVGQDR